jgi:hypothetical protein
MEECLDWNSVSTRNELGQDQVVIIDLGSYTIKGTNKFRATNNLQPKSGMGWRSSANLFFCKRD